MFTCLIGAFDFVVWFFGSIDLFVLVGVYFGVWFSLGTFVFDLAVVWFVLSLFCL